MIKINQTDKIKLAIEKNLIDLFKITNQLKQNDLIKKNYYSSIYSKPYAWPNFVFNLNVEEKNCKEIFSEINTGIEKGNFPPFIITGPKSNKEFFDIFFDEFHIRKIMHWPAMAIDLDSFNFIENKNIFIKKIDDETDLDIWLQIVKNELFNKIELNKRIFLNLMTKKEINLYLGFQNNTAVCTALLFLSESVAGVYMISTSKEYRKSGFGRFITTYALNEAKKMQYQSVVLQATPDGLPVYKKIGFQEFGMFNIYWKIGKL